MPEFFSFPELYVVTGTIEVTVTQAPIWSYSLSGEDEGWRTSGHQIILKPTMTQPQPVLYRLTLVIAGTTHTLAPYGLQISVSSGTATSAAVVFEGTLSLIHDATQTHTLNLGFLVQFLDEQSVLQYHEFNDPTIVFDPPQT